MELFEVKFEYSGEVIEIQAEQQCERGPQDRRAHSNIRVVTNEYGDEAIRIHHL